MAKNFTFHVDINHVSRYGGKVIPDWDMVAVLFISSGTIAAENSGFDLSYEWVYHSRHR